MTGKITEVVSHGVNYDVLHDGDMILSVYHHNSGSVVSAWERDRERWVRALKTIREKTQATR